MDDETTGSEFDALGTLDDEEKPSPDELPTGRDADMLGKFEAEDELPIGKDAELANAELDGTALDDGRGTEDGGIPVE